MESFLPTYDFYYQDMTENLVLTYNKLQNLEMEMKKVNHRKKGKSAETEPESKEKLIMEGNAFYEIDLECVKEKQRRAGNQKADGKMKKPGW